MLVHIVPASSRQTSLVISFHGRVRCLRPQDLAAWALVLEQDMSLAPHAAWSGAECQPSYARQIGRSAEVP